MSALIRVPKVGVIGVCGAAGVAEYTDIDAIVETDESVVCPRTRPGIGETVDLGSRS